MFWIYSISWVHLLIKQKKDAVRPKHTLKEPLPKPSIKHMHEELRLLTTGPVFAVWLPSRKKHLETVAKHGDAVPPRVPQTCGRKRTRQKTINSGLVNGRTIQTNSEKVLKTRQMLRMMKNCFANMFSKKSNRDPQKTYCSVSFRYARTAQFQRFQLDLPISSNDFSKSPSHRAGKDTASSGLSFPSHQRVAAQKRGSLLTRACRAQEVCPALLGGRAVTSPASRMNR